MALKIGVIGATGMAGRAITQEALDHGLQVRAFIHNLDKAKDMFGDQVEYVAKDVFDIQL
ncbi:MAG: NAD(P)H-binding protein [Lentilactobacillus diolivorans]|uniref:NAD(P)H-binding protein n=1 Tax=Lentilactobacillus diolivorans TaxID=179838 RepID=UPI0039E963C5